MSALGGRRHEGRVAIVSGAASGIGRAVATRLAEEGANVVACDINADGLEETCAAIRAAGHELLSVVADVSVDADVGRVAHEAVTAHGRIDALANVAGINDWFLPGHAVDDETWERVIAVNVTGAMLLCRAVLPGMMERKYGAIVNVASVGGMRGGTSGLAYTVSKHALIGLTRSIAWTYRGEGIRCNAICPGAVATNIGATSMPRSDWGYEQLAPIHSLLKRIADPSEIAAPLSWLLADEASSLNGAIVAADDGWSAG